MSDVHAQSAGQAEAVEHGLPPYAAVCETTTSGSSLQGPHTLAAVAAAALYDPPTVGTMAAPDRLPYQNPLSGVQMLLQSGFSMAGCQDEHLPQLLGGHIAPESSAQRCPSLGFVKLLTPHSNRILWSPSGLILSVQGVPNFMPALQPMANICLIVP